MTVATSRERVTKSSSTHIARLDKPFIGKGSTSSALQHNFHIAMCGALLVIVTLTFVTLVSGRSTDWGTSNVGTSLPINGVRNN
jgi:hypothetical protein